MRKVLLLFLFQLFSHNIFAQAKYVVNNDSCLYEKNNYSFVKINNSIVRKNEIIALYSTDFDRNSKEEYGLINKDKNLYINLNDISYINHVDDIQDTIISYYIPKYYFDALKKENVEIIRDNEPFWKEENGWKPDLYGDYPLSWDEEFSNLNYNYLYVKKFKICTAQIDFYIDNVRIQDNKLYILSSYNTYTEHYNISSRKEFLKFNKYEKLRDKKETLFILEFDGDFMNVYIDSDENLLDHYCKTNSKVLSSLRNFVRNIVWNRPYNLSGIIWPHHADGTSEYENTMRIPESLFQVSHKKSLLQNQKTSTNVSPNKTMSVTENLKLRSAEATSTTVLTVMQAGTKVKIIELGKEETIDGIESNWLKVEVISGKDRDGNKLKSGMTGWCYGGYLE